MYYFLSGDPTGIAQSCPGWPCGGFIPSAVGVTVAAGACTGAGDEVMVGAGLPPGVDNAPDGGVTTCVGAGAAPAGEFNGAPTAISQRWPGSPCAGFSPAVWPWAAGAVMPGPSVTGDVVTDMFPASSAGIESIDNGSVKAVVVSVTVSDDTSFLVSWLQAAVAVRTTRSIGNKDLFIDFLWDKG